MTSRDRLTETLVAAFNNDPFYMWLFDEVDRPAALRENFDVVMSSAEDCAHIDTTHDGGGIAIWTDPGQQLIDDPTPFVAMLHRWAPRRAADALAGMEACSVHEPANAHVLHLVAVRPELAGAGAGSRLLSDRLARIDAEAGVAYLESSSPRNHAFYQRLGFRVLDEVPIGSGPSMWPMARIREVTNASAVPLGLPVDVT